MVIYCHILRHVRKERIYKRKSLLQYGREKLPCDGIQSEIPAENAASLALAKNHILPEKTYWQHQSCGYSAILALALLKRSIVHNSSTSRSIYQLVGHIRKNTIIVIGVLNCTFSKNQCMLQYAITTAYWIDFRVLSEVAVIELADVFFRPQLG